MDQVAADSVGEIEGEGEMRTETIGDCTLYLGDCLEILPTLGKVDAVVTDPPYGLGDWNNRGTNAKRPFDSDQTQAWDRPIDARHIDAIRSASKHQVVWGGNYFCDLLPRTKQMFVWNKGIRNMHFNDCEIAWCSQFREACRVFDFSPSASEPKQHPTQKPVALISWCIKKIPDAQTILDPFMGSGTTGVACAKLGRKFIGIELEPRYFDIACERIQKAYDQPDLFVPAPKPAKQEAML
jgi:DNA modification methylase